MFIKSVILDSIEQSVRNADQSCNLSVTNLGVCASARIGMHDILYITYTGGPAGGMYVHDVRAHVVLTTFTRYAHAGWKKNWTSNFIFTAFHC